MSAEIIYESDFATMWFHPEHKIIHHKIHKFIDPAEFGKLMWLGSSVLTEKGSQKWLSDDHTLMMFDRNTFSSGITNFFKKTIENGWKYWAIVQPKNVISQLNLEKVVKEYASIGLETKFFSEIEEAMLWLESK